MTDAFLGKVRIPLFLFYVNIILILGTHTLAHLIAQTSGISTMLLSKNSGKAVHF